MTNFTNDIRRDLLAHIPKTRAGAASALAALLATGAARAGDGFEMVSENERVAEYFMRLAEYFDARPEVREATRDPKRKRDRLVIFCGGEGARRILFETARVHGRLLEGDEAALFEAAAQAARAGAENTRNFASKFGRAKSYGDKTIGTPDAGAVSMARFFKGFAKA